ncbi:AP-4 complex subunit epsilon-1-like [Elysia marginata]|uniref:AP-4 complex subunit epsilon-1-like n=1 Tax=Elysia marginata TaxID=1093978 RepID=A0AAV4H356_9GAST|nr:AP-4 complex subunit epsilon-1-like [Elysia marginata]
MEKTLATLPKLLTQSFGGGKSQTQGGPSALGKEVMNFMKTVHRARSKSQESAIVCAELAAVKDKFKQLNMPNISSSALRNTFTKVIFCHLLGYDVSFLGIEGVKLCSQCEGYNKRLGYLITCLLLNRHSEIALLMMCTLQRDLQSKNMAENWMALTAAGQLVAEDHIEYILDAVVNNLRHSHDIVKEKAVHCLLDFHRVSPAVVQPVLPKLIPLLSSRDPGVLNALANLYLCLSKGSPTELIGLGGSFLHILQQIINRGFGSSFYYHMVPLPWLQISLLKILGNLAAVDSTLCHSVCPVLETLIERTKVTEPISLAILMESVKTATKIKANDKLLELCSACVGKLLSSSAENNMRYQGLGLLISLSKLKPGFAVRHQVAVVECLNDSDGAIQARTTYLLHAMANAANVKAICDKLFEQSESSDATRRQDILMMISDLAERLVSDLSLYLHLYFKIFHSSYVSHLMRAGFVELVLSRVERFTQTSGSGQDASVAHLAKGMLDLLQNVQTTTPNLLLSLHVLGNLAPLLKTQPMVLENFLQIARRICTSSVGNYNDNNVKSCLLHNPQNDNVQSTLNNSDVDELKNTCLQVVTKMVLGECLNVESVKSWLETLDKTKLMRNFQNHCHYEELLHLVHKPQDIALRAEIMFTPKTKFLDLSLSFMDALIVQDILHGKEGFVPRYKVLADRNAMLTQRLDTSMLISSSDNTQTSVTGSLQTSLMKVSSSSSAQSKWRDYDEDDNGEEEQFTLVDVDEGSESLGAERDLFAGLDNLSLEKSSASSIGKHKKLWEDDKNDNDSMKISIGFNFHPFGLPHKSKSIQQEAKWFDEDENDNPKLNDKHNFGVTDFSNLSEKCESPSDFSSNSIYSDFKDSLEVSSTNQGFVHSVKTSTALSYPPSIGRVPAKTNIYNQRLQQYSSGSYLNNVQEMSMSSTVDTLTDSDPAEESDENSLTSTPVTNPQYP